MKIPVIFEKETRGESDGGAFQRYISDSASATVSFGDHHGGGGGGREEGLLLLPPSPAEEQHLHPGVCQRVRGVHSDSRMRLVQGGGVEGAQVRHKEMVSKWKGDLKKCYENLETETVSKMHFLCRAAAAAVVILLL